MARKLTLREKALLELGDFAEYIPEADVREKIAAIYEREAKERGEDDASISLAKAVIMRDGNLDAFEVKPKKPALDEKTERDIQAAAHSFAENFAALQAEVRKYGKPAATFSTKGTRKDLPNFGEVQKEELTPKKGSVNAATGETVKRRPGKAAATKKDLPKNEEIQKEELPKKDRHKIAPMSEPEPAKRKRGRPHKHKAEGGQFSVWLPDETKKRLQILAAGEGISAGELAARFIERGMMGV